MKLTADFHTHTVFSHGKGSILDNARSAKERGLDTIAITDHGYGHTVYGIKRRKLSYMKSLCQEAERETGVKVLLGVESNILGISGKTDMKERDYSAFDIYLAGVHKCITYDKLSEWWYLFGWNLYARKTGKISSELVKRNTSVYINAIKNNPIDILVHPNYCIYADAVEVAKCCRDYGTIFEIDARKPHLSLDEWRAVNETGVNFVINSDAHAPKNVGVIDYAINLVKEVKIDESRILNINGKTPLSLRFTEYKRKL